MRKYKKICIYQMCACSSSAHQEVIIVDKSHMCVSTMLVHVRGHLHLETPPTEQYEELFSKTR